MRIIHAERDSVCMGDDVTAPNADDFALINNISVNEFLEMLCGYVPQMRNVVWEVFCGRKTIGYLYSGDSGTYAREASGLFRRVSELPEDKVFCRYYWNLNELADHAFPKGSAIPERIRAYRKKQ